MESGGVGRRELLKLGLTASGLIAAGGLLLPEAAWARGPAGLVSSLNGAIDKEQRAIWAYKTAAGTGKLSDPALKVATAFLNQHKEHAAVLGSVVRKLRGKPVPARAKYDLAAFNPDLNDEKGILTLALKLESDAVKAYYAALGMLADHALHATAASIFADEAMHVAVLRNALGLDPVPVAFVTDPTAWSLT